MQPSPNCVIIFDGECNLCNGIVQFILKHNKQKNLLFAPLQGTYACTLLATHNIHPTTNYNTIYYYYNHTLYQKSTAALHIAQQLNMPYKMLYIFIIVPAAIRNYVYNYVAKNRYKWYGKQTSCYMPTPELTKRFL